jgi:hypothetical protein
MYAQATATDAERLSPDCPTDMRRRAESMAMSAAQSKTPTSRLASAGGVDPLDVGCGGKI